MVLIPPSDQATAELIYSHYEQVAAAEPRREHLGASEIGKECTRSLWLSFRWAMSDKFPGRILRLFETGKLEEKRVHRNLRAIGIKLTGTKVQRQKFVADLHFGGSCDGIATNVPEAPKKKHILEVKTFNDRLFKLLQSKGVREAKPEHEAQCQVYMHLFNAPRTLYIAVNKNTDELYIERIRYDKERAEALLERAQEIIESPEPPPVEYTATSMTCKYCKFKPLCHGEEFVAEKNCRTCIHSTVETGGWRCEVRGQRLSPQEVALGCSWHLFIPGLQPASWGEPTEATAARITYPNMGSPKINLAGGAIEDLPVYGKA